MASIGCMTSDVSEYAFIKCEFIKRTLKIINQYEDFVEKNNDVPSQEKFEITLLINCLLGLLIFPKELYEDRLRPISKTQLEKWGFQLSFIKKWGEKGENQQDLFYIIRRLRNSIAHVSIRVGKEGKEIVFIEFKDTNPENLEDIFEVRMSKDDLKNFGLC